MIPTWLARYGSADSDARVKLLCFPFAGGAASYFRPWIASLAPVLDVVPIQLPGREERWNLPPFEQLTPLIEALIADLRPFLARGPFALFGHSMGALVAYEFAQALQRGGLPAPVHLFVSGRRAPQLAARLPTMHDLPQSAFIERLRRLNGTPEAVLASGELMAVFTPLLRADLAVCENYAAEAPLERLTSPITALGGTRDDELAPGDLSAWQRVTSGPLTVHEFPGGHFFIERERAAVLQIVRDTLGSAGSSAPPSMS